MKMTQIPEGMTEQEVLEIIDNVVNRLGALTRYGYHDIEDIKQDGRLEAWKGLAKHDGVRPLENFLYIHVKNRLLNNKRKHYERLDKPCARCPLNAYIKKGDICTAFDFKEECSAYSKWLNRNTAKKNIMNTIHIGNVEDEKEGNMRTEEDPAKKIDMDEFYELIDKNLPVLLRSDFVKIKRGIKVPKCRRDKVYESIKQILEENGLDEPEAW